MYTLLALIEQGPFGQDLVKRLMNGSVHAVACTGTRGRKFRRELGTHYPTSFVVKNETIFIIVLVVSGIGDTHTPLYILDGASFLYFCCQVYWASLLSLARENDVLSSSRSSPISTFCRSNNCFCCYCCLSLDNLQVELGPPTADQEQQRSPQRPPPAGVVVIAAPRNFFPPFSSSSSSEREM